MNFSKYIKILLLSAAASSIYASDEMMVNRYATVSTKPLEEQINPLLAIGEFKFPIQVKTVGDAVEMILHQTGYSLIAEQNQSKYVQLTLKKPLPVTVRKLGPIKVNESLEVLMGKHVFFLEVDQLNRRVDFKLKKSVASKLGENNATAKSV